MTRPFIINHAGSVWLIYAETRSEALAIVMDIYKSMEAPKIMAEYSDNVRYLRSLNAMPGDMADNWDEYHSMLEAKDGRTTRE